MIDLFLLQMSINEHCNRNWRGGFDLLLWLPSPSTKLGQPQMFLDPKSQRKNNAPTIAL